MDKLYSIAKSIAGELGKDLVHHTFLLMPDIDLQNNAGYFVRSMINEYYNKNSKFNKLYSVNSYPLTDNIQDEFNTDCVIYDANLLHKIFLELESEGLAYEVGIFKESTLVSSQTKVAKRLKKSRCMTIHPICKMITEEIRKRYEVLNR